MATKPSVNEATSVLMAACKKDAGTEITISESGVEILWGNLRVNCDPEDMQKATNAVSALQELGAYFV